MFDKGKYQGIIKYLAHSKQPCSEIRSPAFCRKRENVFPSESMILSAFLPRGKLPLSVRVNLLAMGQKNTLILAFVKHLWKLFFFLLYRSTFFAWGENKNQ